MNADMRELGDELCGRFAFSLVHSHDWLVAGAAERVARGVELPWLTTVHATEYGRHQGWVDKHPQSHIHAAERAMVRRADHVITCSRYMRSHIATVFGVRHARITAIQNGIDHQPKSQATSIATASEAARYGQPSFAMIGCG